MSIDTPNPVNYLAAARVIGIQAQYLSDLAEKHGLETLADMLAMTAMAARDEQRQALDADRLAK
jgi:hypothetical protein